MSPAGAGLWMIVDDVFHIRGRGAVLTGLLQGDGQLNLGDSLLGNGQSWPVSGIEQLGRALTTALPGANVGILIGNEAAAQALRGRMVQFDSSGGSQSGMPSPIVAPPKRRRWRG